MKTLAAVVVVLLAGCGNSKRAQKDGAPPDDAVVGDVGHTIDAAWFEPPPCPDARAGSTISFREIGRVDVTGAVLATSPPKDPRLFVVERKGAVRLFKNEVLETAPFIDLSQDAGGPVIGALGDGDERGLLGLAFDPDYATTGHFFVYYTGAKNGDLYDFLVRCTASPTNPDSAPRSSCVEMIAFRDPYSNHNGGMLEFGPDGFLYVSTGDGGGGGDPFGYSQDLMSFHGKMLRLDIKGRDAGKEYAGPADNPFIGMGLPEIYMRGLRNPWRWSFDRVTLDMWIGEVGSNLAEELDVLRRSEQRGANLGWSVYEGNSCCATTPFHCASAVEDSMCDPTGFTFPKFTKTGGGWRAIIAGEVYRGSCFPDLVGWHYFTDWSQRDLVKARLLADGTLEVVPLPIQVPNNPSSIHSDSRGELYVTTVQGFIYRLEAGP
jgi:glucose/arabinose dehydrogenase